MGLFSSKKITNVGTSVARVIEDDAVPNSIANGAAKNLFQDGEQLTEYVLEEMTTSIGLRAGRMHRYGATKYPYGLPRSSLKTSAAGQDAARAAISAQVGATVDLDYYHFGAFNNLHFGWLKLISDYDYDSRTNELPVLSAAKGATVYLKDMQVVVTNATLAELANGSMDQWGIAACAGPTPANGMLSWGTTVKPTPFAVDPGAVADYVRVDICWTAQVTTTVEGVTYQKPVVQYESINIPVGAYDVDADYHHARFSINGKAGFWTYKEGSGVTPAVDAVFSTAYAEGGTFFPFMYFRYEKKSANENKNSEWFKSSVKLANHLNMDFEAITDAVNQNPDINDVEQAMMIMAVPASTSNTLEQRYLFDFFDGIQHEAQDLNTSSAYVELLGIKLELTGINGEVAVIIQDKRFKMALGFRNIVKKQVGGVIGPIGSHQSGRTPDALSTVVPVIGGDPVTWTTTVPMHWYRRQISDTVFEEVRVYNLKMTYWVFENYTTVGDENDDILLIPLNQAITKHYSIPDREVLYARSLHYVFNSRVVTKVKWYQRGIFKTIMIIASIVITVVSYGQTWQAMAAAIAAGTVTIAAVLTAIVIGVLKYAVTMVAIKLFVKVVGPEFAFLAAIIAAVTGMYKAIEAGSLQGAPWAKELLSVSTGLSKGVNAAIQDDFNDLIGQASEFEKYMEDQTKLLDSANALLDNGLHLSPMIIFGENPSEFYQRTVHSGNIGPVGVEAVGSYVDLALQLPKLTDTIGV